MPAVLKRKRLESEVKRKECTRVNFQLYGQRVSALGKSWVRSFLYESLYLLESKIFFCSVPYCDCGLSVGPSSFLQVLSELRSSHSIADMVSSMVQP